MALGKRFFSSEAVYVFCVVTGKKKTVWRDKTRLYLRTWWCWLLSQPQDQIAQKEEARLTACTCDGKASVSALELMGENHTSQSCCRNGKRRGSETALWKKDLRHVFRSSLFFTFLGRTWAQNLCPWHWRLWNIAGFLQSQIRIKDHVILFWTCFGWEAAMYSASSLDMNLRILTTSISPYYNNTLNGNFLRLFFHVRKLK